MILKTKKSKFLIPTLALVLVCAIAFGFVAHERSRYFCQYAKPFAFTVEQGQKAPVPVAHRGAAVYAPENTLPAYEQAAKKGYRYAETDIRATADGVWVLSHDSNLKRMTGFNGVVEKMRAEEVLAHPITKGGNIKQYPNLYTPTLKQFLELCVKEQITPVIEIKTKAEQYPNAPFENIVLLVRQFGLEEQAVIISFDVKALELVRLHAPQIKEQLLVKKMSREAITTAQKLGNCGIDCAYASLLKNPELCKVAQSAGMELNAWTVDKAKPCEELVALGVDFITTNAAMPTIHAD